MFESTGKAQMIGNLSDNHMVVISIPIQNLLYYCMLAEINS